MNFLQNQHRTPVNRLKIAFSFIFLIAPLLLIAQDDYKPKLGFIDRESLDMTVYPGDSTADAVVLYDYAEVNFSFDDQRGFVITTTYWERIKILKESALDRASVSLRYYDGNSYKYSENVTDISGYTFNLVDNRIVTSEMDRKAIKTEKLSENNQARRFNLPNVKKGSVIEYTYTVTTPMNVRDKPSTWSFQTSVPVKWSEYRVTIPDMLYYKIIMGGYLSLSINERERVNVRMGHSKFDGSGTKYRFVLKNAPAFNKEPFITTPADYISKINFELETISIPGEVVKSYSNTWEKVDETYTDATWFGGELRKNVFSKEIKEEILKKAKDSTEKMNLGYAFIQSKMKWDETAGLQSIGGIKKAFENKKGSASEINLLLTNLLRDLGLDSDPIVLSTRTNGRMLEHVPSFEAFNYAICRVKIGDKEYLLDASQSFAKLGMLPEHVLNGQGRLIPRKGPGHFVELKPRESKATLEMIEAQINPDEGTLKGTYAASLGGYDALDWREEYATEPEQTYVDALKKEFPEWKIQNVAVTNKSENLSSVVSVKCAFEAEDENSSPGVFYFNPMLAGRMKENPLKAPERIYPLDLATGISSSFVGNYKLPDGYFLEEVPKPEIIVLPEKAGKFLFQVKQTGSLIQVNSSMILSKLTFVAEEYELLREFFERVVQKHAQQLVIKKK
jgi:hypothetical protein